MLSFQNSCAVNTWMDCSINTQPSALSEVRYIRGGAVPDTDVKLYDLGNFLYGTTTTDTEAPGDLGYLFVDYEVDLINPAAHIAENAEAEFMGVHVSGGVLASPFGNSERYGNLPVQVGPNFLQFNRVGIYNLALKAGAWAAGKSQSDLVDAGQTTVGWTAAGNSVGGVVMSVDNFTSANNFIVEVTESFQRLYTNFQTALQGMASFTNALITVAPLFAAVFDPAETLEWHPAKKAVGPCLSCIAREIPAKEAKRRIAAMRLRGKVTSTSTSSSAEPRKIRDE
jgi:hypothetical protein